MDDASWIVIPVKSLTAAKSRLAAVLSPEERERLARRLAAATFEVVTAARASSGARVAVVTSDASVASMAAAHRWRVIPDPGIDHSAAMVAAGAWVLAQGGSTLITVAVDLPRLTVRDIDVLTSLAAPRTLVIGPDHSGHGTNAIAVSPPCFPFEFGPGSFLRHTRAARELGLSVRVLRLPGLGADLDDPSDLAILSG